jgi:hypothetical protein
MLLDRSHGGVVSTGNHEVGDGVPLRRAACSIRCFCSGFSRASIREIFRARFVFPNTGAMLKPHIKIVRSSPYISRAAFSACSRSEIFCFSHFGFQSQHVAEVHVDRVIW